MDFRQWASTLEFAPMTVVVAREIADTWHYPEPFDFYDATADPDDYQDFISPARWPAHFFQVRSRDELVGFFTGSPHGETCEISLGLHPRLAGDGRGLSFLRAGLAHLESYLSCGCDIVLDVAEFNQRAIRVYERAGFTVIMRFDQQTNGTTVPFVAMAMSVADTPRTGSRSQ